MERGDQGHGPCHTPGGRGAHAERSGGWWPGKPRGSQQAHSWSIPPPCTGRR
ncbi:MAG: hypothetical protein WDA12_04905 [Bacilli bacterium]